MCPFLYAVSPASTAHDFRGRWGTQTAILFQQFLYSRSDSAALSMSLASFMKLRLAVFRIRKWSQARTAPHTRDETTQTKRTQHAVTTLASTSALFTGATMWRAGRLLHRSSRCRQLFVMFKYDKTHRNHSTHADTTRFTKTTTPRCDAVASLTASTSAAGAPLNTGGAAFWSKLATHKALPLSDGEVL